MNSSPSESKMHFTRTRLPELETAKPASHSWALNCKVSVEATDWRKLLHRNSPDLCFSSSTDMHTPPRAIIAMTTAEVGGEQVSGPACTLNSLTRPQAALTHQVEKFMLAVLLNGFQKKSWLLSGEESEMEFPWGPWGIDFFQRSRNP